MNSYELLRTLDIEHHNCIYIREYVLDLDDEIKTGISRTLSVILIENLQLVVVPKTRTQPVKAANTERN